MNDERRRLTGARDNVTTPQTVPQPSVDQARTIRLSEVPDIPCPCVRPDCVDRCLEEWITLDEIADIVWPPIDGAT